MALYAYPEGKGDKVGTQSANLVYKLSDDGLGASALVVGGVTLHAGYAPGDAPPLGYVWKWWRFNSPSTFEELVKVDVDVRVIDPHTFEATAIYGPYDYLAAEETTPGGGGGGGGGGSSASSEWTFEVKASNAKVTHSIETVGSYVAGAGPASDYKGAMNVTKDGVQGLDVPKPQASFTRTYYTDPAAFTDAYKAALTKAVGKMNSETYNGYPAGEVMLMGLSASGRGRENVQMVAQFDVSENADDLTVGEITGIVKKGWHALWVKNIDETDPVSNTSIKIPSAAYVEKVCEEIDFEADLGL